MPITHSRPAASATAAIFLGLVQAARLGDLDVDHVGRLRADDLHHVVRGVGGLISLDQHVHRGPHLRHAGEVPLGNRLLQQFQPVEALVDIATSRLQAPLRVIANAVSAEDRTIIVRTMDQLTEEGSANRSHARSTEALADPSIRHVVPVSRGKDSAALAIYMAQTYPQIPTEYVFCDTDAELTETYDYLDRLEALLGKPLHRITNLLSTNHSTVTQQNEHHTL